MNKNSKMYFSILTAWVILLYFSLPELLAKINSEIYKNNFQIAFLLTANVIFISYFWLNGMKDIFYVFLFHKFQNKWLGEEKKSIQDVIEPFSTETKVALIYTTKDDFDESSLLICSKQDFKNCHVYILDDSTQTEYIKRIDDFVKSRMKFSVIRRTHHTGFKAGNLNSFLKDHCDEFEYFVILDSDEIIPHNFVDIALKYFFINSKLGILQANHVATRNVNRFMRTFYVGVNCHWPTYQKVKEKYGFLSFLGHGAMISSNCYKRVGKFPELVAEDLCFSILAKKRGFDISFSRLITCEEEFPIDYRSFKIRHYKWTLGNFELMRKFSKEIFLTKQLKWFEKIDVFLFTYNLPLTFVFFNFLVINILILPLLGCPAQYPLWLLIPTVIFLFSPMFNDIIILFPMYKFWKMIKYCLLMFLLYGSLFWISLYAAILSFFGKKAYFYVTPKTYLKLKRIDKIKNNWQEISFGMILLFVTLIVNHSCWPSILIVIPSLSGYFLDGLSDYGKFYN